ncbi:MAG: histidine kinase [Lachnospiraceae bacterium]|nr:histidine kinase [Lachnospiraceae bacterium]
MKLRIKFFLIFSLLAIVPLLTISIFSYTQYEQTIYSQMEEFSDNVFQNAVSETENTLETISNLISFMTFYSNENEYSIVETLKTFAGDEDSYTSYDILIANKYCNSVFQNLMLTNESIQGIYIFTPSGVIFSNSTQYSTLNPRYTVGEGFWYSDIIEMGTELFISTYVDGDVFTDSYDSIFFAKAIYGIYDHTFLGIIMVDYNPEIFDLSSVNTLSDYTLLTISDKGTDLVLYTNIDDLPEDISKANRKISKADLSVTHLELTAVFDYDALYEEFNLTGTLLAAIAIVCIVGYIILAYVISKYLVRPIESLSQAMSHQDSRHLEFSSPYMNRKDEIGTLYNEYANMLEELDASIKKEYRDKLVVLNAQMESLEARINSHFLFNTLESINSMAELDDNEPIATMSLALGNMFRYTIKTRSELVTLEEELNHVKDYVSIQQIRFSNQFSLVLDIAPELYQKKILKLILQPLVENALYHGLEYCSCGDTITISALQEATVLCLEVRDNGKGISEEVLLDLNNRLKETPSFSELGRRSGKSIGLKNIHSRIELYYGQGYGLHVSSKEGEGTVVAIRVPVLND